MQPFKYISYHSNNKVPSTIHKTINQEQIYFCKLISISDNINTWKMQGLDKFCPLIKEWKITVFRVSSWGIDNFDHCPKILKQI